MNSYWLDSDVLVYAKDNFAPFGYEVSLGFWHRIEDSMDKGLVKITKMNFLEITEARENKDDLAKWLKMRKREGICVPPNKQVQEFATGIADYIYSNTQFSARYREEFSKGADAWLIAQAAVDSGVVVTREVCDARSHRPKIPDICKQFDVRWISLIELIKILGR